MIPKLEKKTKKLKSSSDSRLKVSAECRELATVLLAKFKELYPNAQRASLSGMCYIGLLNLLNYVEAQCELMDKNGEPIEKQADLLRDKMRP